MSPTRQMFRWSLLLFLCMTNIVCTSLETRKHQSEAIRGLAEAYMADNNYHKALQELANAEKLYNQDPFVYNDYGFIYMSIGKYELAVDSFKKAVDLKPDYSPARNNLGTAYMKLEKWDKAIECFKEVSNDLLYMTPHFPLANLGWAYYHKKDFAAAERYHVKALKYMPNFVLSLRGLGLVYLAQGRIADAKEQLKKAISIEPQKPELYFDMARAYTLSGDKMQALYAYEKVIELAPESDLAKLAKMALEKL